MSKSMQAYDEAQALYLAGPKSDEDGLDFHDRILFTLLRKYAELNNQGVLTTIVRKAQRDLSAL